MTPTNRSRVRAWCCAMLLALVAIQVPAQSVWKDEHGQSVADSPDRKSINDFGGMLLLTPDSDREPKWSTPPEKAPHFGNSYEVKVGRHLNHV